MRAVTLAVCASLAFAGGCAQLATAVGVQPATVSTVHLRAGQAFELAFDGLDSVALIAEAAVKSGALHGPPAAKVAADLRKAQSVLEIAYDGYRAGTVADPTKAITDAANFLADAKSLAGGASH